MTTSPLAAAPVVVVTGANGLVGSHVCEALVAHGATVRAVVRRAGTAPDHPGVEEVVGDFADPALAADALHGADAAVTTVHPLGGDAETQRRIGVHGTSAFARAAADAGVARLVHVSTAAVYDRSPQAGDVDESSALVGDDANAYAVTKRDTDAGIAAIPRLTRVLLRPPAILGPGDSSVWNSLTPAEVRDDENARRANPAKTFAWVHVRDLARLAADVAAGRIAADGVAGPRPGECTPVNVAADGATWGDYLGTVAEAVGVEPVWTDEPVWTGRLLTDRARAWGWTPEVSLAEALAEVAAGLGAHRA